MAETRLIIVPDQYVFLASLKNRGFSIGDGHPYSGLKYDDREFFGTGIFWLNFKKTVKPPLRFLVPHWFGAGFSVG